ncbi:MAG: RNA methyltransferase [Lachnospiraceae bacterium]|nr:RNA methyltransferase [Lachnospiraceae bacterium]
MLTSTANPRVKRIIKLNKKAAARTAEQVFVIEGIKLFMEAPEQLIKEVYITQSIYTKYISEQNFSDPQQELVNAKLLRINYEIVSDDVFARMSDTQTPQGLLCVVRQRHFDLNGLPFAGNSLYLVLEDIQDPGNLGTIFRTAEAAGVEAVIMSRGCADIYNPKTIRATMGSVFRVGFAYVDDLLFTLEALKAQDIELYAACLDNSEYYDKLDYRRGTAFLIGSEGHGLKEETKKTAKNLKIPMGGQVESLNAATATAILLFEAARQRRT